ncbi:MAG: hypothetical protein HC808_16310 [Candidatus Competibacteraceae bacterium]|nr:hypothetical protein [Candidatus Competibacteraceae bacterium]
MSPETQSILNDRLRIMTDELRSLLANYLFGVYRKCLSNAYFTCYHAVILILEGKGLSASGREALHKSLNAHFIKTGLLNRQVLKNLDKLESQQQAADYRGYLLFDEDDVHESLGLALPLLDELLSYIQVNLADCDWELFVQRLDGVKRLLPQN